jgi:hypothetical protein
MVIAVEGLRFLWALRPRVRRVSGERWPKVSFTAVAYLKWRLGTVYGSFVEPGSIAERPLRALLRDLWNDRERAAKFLVWARDMRRLSRRR